MNNAYRAGARAAQGFQDSKNPYDSVVSGCYSIYYWMMDRLHNGGGPGGPARHGQRHRLYGGRLGADRMGGWGRSHQRDLELSVQCAWRRYRSLGPKRRSPMTSSPDLRGVGEAAQALDQQDSRWLGYRRVGRGWGPSGGPGRAHLLIPAYQAAALINLALRLAEGRWGRRARPCCAAARRQFGQPPGGTPGGPCADGGGKWDRRLGAAWPVLAVSAQLGPHHHPLYVKDHRLGGDPPYRT